MKTLKSADLQFIEGTSSKEYHAQVVEVSAGKYAVNFQYGRIGSALKDGTKTEQLVSKDAAIEIFDDLVASKTKKGYQIV